MQQQTPGIGIIGGSGLYHLDAVSAMEELEVTTPWGPPSDAIRRGSLGGRDLFFLPRHGRGHRILPHEINHRANIYALRSLGVRWIISVSAVGSLQPHYQPRDVVLPDQFFDRTSRRADHTFFGNGIAAHIAFADPVSPGLRALALEAAQEACATVHNGGTYVNMDGPAFSTRAESRTNQRLGFDVIGMTNLGEAKLAREAEIAYVTLAMVTDYDSWNEQEEAVTAETVIGHLHHNIATAREIILRLIPKVPTVPDWPEHRALAGAVMTPRECWPCETSERLALLLQPYL